MDARLPNAAAAKCSDAAATQRGFVEGAARAREEYGAAIDRLHKTLAVACRENVYEARHVRRARAKVLDTKIVELAVTANQLEAPPLGLTLRWLYT